MNWIGAAGDKYIEAVWRAVTDPVSFRTFRRDAAYCEILEHVTDELGRKYLELIDNKQVRQVCLASEFADTIGNPVVGSYECRRLSPTTLRYSKILNDLVQYFPNFYRMKSIVEIGVGYGGQARIISEFSHLTYTDIQSYTLIDLYPVLLLCREYLEHFSLHLVCYYLTRSEIQPLQTWNLAISTYAFSEFGRQLQEEYIRLVLLKAKAGYLIMNTERAEQFTANELLEILPNGIILEEQPKTKSNNYVLLFGEHSYAA